MLMGGGGHFALNSKSACYLIQAWRVDDPRSRATGEKATSKIFISDGLQLQIGQTK